MMRGESLRSDPRGYTWWFCSRCRATARALDGEKPEAYNNMGCDDAIVFKVMNT